MPATPLRAILVHVDDGPDARARVELALSIAARTGARLIGAAAGRVEIPAYAPYSESLISLQPEIMKAAAEQIERAVAAAKATFDAVAGARSDAEWRSTGFRFGEDFLCAEARSADLVVVGRPGTSDTPGPSLSVVPADVVMAAGRPVLIAPPGVRSLPAKRIAIAWKDAREARRALADAMPLLALAEDVFVVSVGTEPQAGVDDVVASLKRADINARALVEDGGRLADGEALIEIARRAGADLIVAGAFGHSRMREWAFGGVTRELLYRAPVCCLLSH